MKSWKTTLLGILAGLPVIATQLTALLDGLPETVFSLEALLAGLGAMGIGVVARDNNKTSAQAGAEG